MEQMQYIIIVTLLVTLSTVPWAIGFFSIKKGKKFLLKKKANSEESIMVAQEISSSVTEIISAKKGGTIIIDVTDDVLQNIGNLTRLDAKVSSDLISSIFNSSTSALHDGALIIKDGRIHSAAAYIKSLSQRNLPNKYGSRHRSSLGLSENSDAIVIVVSEERKQVSVFYKGDYEVVDTSDLTTYIARLWFGTKK